MMIEDPIVLLVDDRVTPPPGQIRDRSHLTG